MGTKILFVVQLPPPVHGAAVINKLIVENEAIRSSYTTRVLPLKFVTDVSSIRRFSIKKIILMVGFLFRLVGQLISYRPHLVYFTISPAGNSFYRDALFIFIIKLFRCKLVFHLHSRGIQQGMTGSLARKVYRFVYREAYVISLSGMLNQEFAGLPVKEIFILPNGIPDSHYDLSGRPDNPVHILFLANLFRAKGTLVFLEVVKKLAEAGYSFKAQMAGAKGDLSVAEIEKMVNEYKLSDYLSLTGPLYGDEKRQAFKNAGIFCMPSLDEAFPLVVLEAMQASQCIVASRVGAVPEILADGVSGFLCTSGDVDEFASKIGEAINDPSLRERIAANAHAEYKNRFTEEVFNSNLKKIIDELMS